MKRLVLVVFGAAVLSACGRDDRPAGPKGQAGAAGSASGGSGGVAGDDLRAVASVLDGYVLKQPCLSESGPRACRTHAPGACPVSQDPAFAGSTPTRDTLSFGGQSGTLYDVTLHVQGIVEPKVYRGGSDASDLATNGFLTAGTIDNVRNQHSAYALRVTVPTGIYFFNSLGRENVRHSAFPVDYEATVTIQGATPIELWISDPNCEALRNCGDPDVPTECTPVDLPSLEPKIRESLGAEPSGYDGQFLGFVVRNVTARN
jgi:hypothetical protein